MTVAVLLLAAGTGERLAAGRPKALYVIGGSSLLEHSYCAFAGHPRIDRIVVTAPADLASDVAEAMSGRADVVAGGRTRQDSVRLGLGELPAEVDIVLVHDAARPFVPLDLIDRVLGALDAGADAAVPALVITDTIKRVGPGGAVVATLDRAELRAVQTPQGFRREELAAAHAYAQISGLRDVTDDAALVERHGGRVVLVPGADSAFKITRPWDLLLAEAYLAARA